MLSLGNAIARGAMCRAMPFAMYPTCAEIAGRPKRDWGFSPVRDRRSRKSLYFFGFLFLFFSSCFCRSSDRAEPEFAKMELFSHFAPQGMTAACQARPRPIFTSLPLEPLDFSLTSVCGNSPRAFMTSFDGPIFRPHSKAACQTPGTMKPPT